MGEKKPKKLDSATTSRNHTPSPSSHLFQTLFGDAVQISASSSIFSDSNPFKRKPLEESVKNPSHDDEKQKRKRKQEKSINLDRYSTEAEEANLVVSKKAKEVQIHNPNVGQESKEETPKVDFENNDKKRKKRKRDELEAEYEAKKYGAVPGNVENAVALVGEKRKKPDDVSDMLVSKEGEGFDDENKLLRTVFVGNLPLKIKKKALIREFSKFGEIESVRVRSVPIMDTKIPRKGAIILNKINDAADSVHAYIVFNTEQAAEASLAHNMSVLGGNHIRVDGACPPRKKLKGMDAPLYDYRRTIFVGNLPFDVKDEEIYQLFSSIKDVKSSIEAVRVIRDAHIGLGKGIAYVLFKTREAATFVVKKRNLKLRDRELRLSLAKQDSTLSKRRNPFAAEAANPPSKKLGVDSRMPNHKSGLSTKGVASYQGLRATKSKSGVQKKAFSFGHAEQISGAVKTKSKSKAQRGEKQHGKRPAVAARKAKAKALKDDGASKQAGIKRKLDSRTPESFSWKKRARKF